MSRIVILLLMNDVDFERNSGDCSDSGKMYSYKLLMSRPLLNWTVTKDSGAVFYSIVVCELVLIVFWKV
jgi:hypothetical protein